MKKSVFTLALITIISLAYSQQYVWIQKANFGAGGRYAAFSFEIGGKGYVGSGVGFSSGTLQYIYIDFWEYDPQTDAWTQKADVPGNSKSGATGFSIGQKGYVTLGWEPAQTDETYEYDPVSNSWTSKANFGGGARYCATSFVIDSFAYVGLGYTPYYKDFWKYNASTDAWTQIADVGGPARSAGSSFVLNGFGYVFGGAQQFSLQSNELWQYDPTLNIWNQKASMPDTGRNGGVGFALNGFGFIGLGGNDLTAFFDFWKYDPVNDSWAQIDDFGGGTRIVPFSFAIGNKAYVGAGSLKIYPNIVLSDDVWELTYTDANNISGKLFMDFNNNNTQDAGEPSMANRLISESNSGRFCFSRPDGSYNLAVLSSGSFSATTDSIGYFAPNPSSQNVNFSGINETDSLNDFAFQASAAINDLCVTISPTGNFRAGFDAHYVVSYENSGTTSLPASIMFFPDSSLTFVSASVTPDSVYTDSVFWDLGILSPFQQGSISITVNVNSSVPIGTLINSAVRIDPVVGDTNPACNYNAWEILTTGSFDPNDILVNLETIEESELINPPYLEYLIRFQNTGNDTAFTVDILNPVPAGVDFSTFELVASSHPVAVRYIQDYNTLGFKFSNILLVDSNMNEPLSHGFARYRIKPQSALTAGSSIQNTAGIYFDFNPVVNTNTAITDIVNTTSIQQHSYSSISISPNPVTDKINIKTKGSGDFKISIYNTEGKCILRNNYKGKSIEIPFKYFSNGIYLVKVQGENEIMRTKIYKE